MIGQYIWYHSKESHWFRQNNGYIQESIQKAGISQLLGCVGHVCAICEAIASAKEERSDISVIQFGLANTYHSAPHAM